LVKRKKAHDFLDAQVPVDFTELKLLTSYYQAFMRPSVPETTPLKSIMNPQDTLNNTIRETKGTMEQKHRLRPLSQKYLDPIRRGMLKTIGGRSVRFADKIEQSRKQFDGTHDGKT